MMDKPKSIGINAVLNVIKSCLSVLFPLITYPYVLRIIGTLGIGKVAYVTSVTNYFSLLAMLGVATYAVREGAKYREDKTALKKFADEIFTVNTVFTVISCISFLVTVLSVRQFQEYKILFFIQGLSILFQTFSVDWINRLFEDYLFITLRTILTYVITLVLLFVFVNSENDYYIYAVIQVLPSGVICVSNWMYCRRYVKVRITTHPNFKKHIIPLVVLFANSLMVSIYVNFDTTMLGWLKGDYYVGLYALAAKIYNVVKGIMIAVYTVTIPRLAGYVGRQDDQSYKRLYTNLWSYLSLLLVPMAVGIICLAEEAVYLMGGSKFYESAPALIILAFALIFAIYGGLLTSCLNITLGREKTNLKITIISAGINIILNFYFIPHYSHVGAAITTLISEMVVVGYCFIATPDKNKYLDMREVSKNICHAVCGSALIWIYAWFIKQVVSNYIQRIFVVIAGAVFIYGGILLLFRNSIFKNFIISIKSKCGRIHRG